MRLSSSCGSKHAIKVLVQTRDTTESCKPGYTTWIAIVGLPSRYGCLGAIVSLGWNAQLHGVYLVFASSSNMEMQAIGTLIQTIDVTYNCINCGRCRWLASIGLRLNSKCWDSNVLLCRNVAWNCEKYVGACVNKRAMIKLYNKCNVGFVFLFFHHSYQFMRILRLVANLFSP